MTPMRARMIEDMKLAGLAARTQEVYIQAVCGLAKYYKKSPELLDEEEVRRYLLDVSGIPSFVTSLFLTDASARGRQVHESPSLS